MVSEKNRILFEFFAIFEIVNIASSVVTNLILIYLILYRSSKEIGAYRFLLLAFAINDIYFPVIHFLTLPVICSYKDAFIMFAHGFLSSKFSISLFGCTFSQTMPLLAHLFIYRLIATKWPRHLQFYTARSCCLLIVGTLAVESPVWFANCYINYGSDAETREYVQPFLDDEFNGEDREFIGALYYSIDGTFRLRAFFATMGFNSIMTICMSIIVYCSVAIVRHLSSKNVEWSGKTKKLQQQLFQTLVVQMIIPMIFVYFPCAGIINLPMFGFRMSVFPNLVSASLTLFPLIDAFIVMFGVKSYRQTLFVFSKVSDRSILHSNSVVKTTIIEKSKQSTTNRI